MKKIVLIGAGGHCKSCIDVILQAKKHEIVAILGKPEEKNKALLNYQINGTDDDIRTYISQGCEFLITVGQIKTVASRLKLYQYLIDNKAQLATVISPLAYVSSYATIGLGTIIMHNALVNADAEIGNNCIINSKALIEHDAVIESHCHISTAAIINGNVRIKANSFVGSNTTVVQGKLVEKSSFIKAGTLVK